jgi:hypothetical protein
MINSAKLDLETIELKGSKGHKVMAVVKCLGRCSKNDLHKN